MSEVQSVYKNETLQAAVSDHPNTPFIILDGLEESIVGVGCDDADDPCLIYDHEQILQILQEDSEMTRFEAREWFDFNIESLTQLKHGPIFQYEDEYSY